MSAADWVAAGSLFTLAALHSFLGERLLVGPLLAVDPWPALRIGRTLGRQTLRFAWHLTSVAWLGLGVLLLGPADSGALFVPAVVGAVLLASGIFTFATTRGRHFAWAPFLAGALAAMVELGAVTDPVAAGLGWAAGATFAAIALLHVGWALGLRWGIGAALPSVDGRPTPSPPRWMTLLVALALGFAAWLALGLARALPPPPLARWLGLGGAAMLGARTLGDVSTMGLFKRVHGTLFARWDDLVFTPLCFFLGACLLLLGVRAG